jgi:hypothetical protein
VLAVSYVLQLEELAREIDTLNVATGVAMAMGAPVAPISWASARDEFDADLAGELRGESARDQSVRGIKLRSLGIT